MGNQALSEKELNRLLDDLIGKEGELSRMLRAIRDIQREIQSLPVEMPSLRENNQRASEMIADFERECSNQKQWFSNFQTETENFLKESESHREGLRQLVLAELAERGSEADQKLSAVAAEARESMASLQSELAGRFEAERSRLETLKGQLNQQLTAFREQYSSLAARLENSAEERQRAFESYRQTADMNIASLQSDNRRFQDEIRALNKKLEELLVKHDRLVQAHETTRRLSVDFFAELVRHPMFAFSRGLKRMLMMIRHSG